MLPLDSVVKSRRKTGDPAVGISSRSKEGGGLEIPGGGEHHQHHGKQESHIQDSPVTHILRLVLTLGSRETKRHLEGRHKTPKTKEKAGEGGQDKKQERESVGVQQGEGSTIEETEVADSAVMGLAVGQTFRDEARDLSMGTGEVRVDVGLEFGSLLSGGVHVTLLQVFAVELLLSCLLELKILGGLLT